MDALLKLLDEASNDGDINKLKQLIEEDPLLLDKVLTEVRDTPLHIAALKGHADFTSEVLRLKPELARRLNSEGRAPLHLAAARGHLQVAEILVDKVGSDICLIRESIHGYMPVHIATVNRNHDIVRMLVEKCNETLEKATNRLETLLHLAVTANCIDSVRFLIDQGVKFNEKDDNGNTCLHLAVSKPNRHVIRHLLDQEGIQINITNAMGLTPLDVLLVSSLCSGVDNIISLVDTIRRAGGVRATELGDLESNMNSSVIVRTPTPSNQRFSRGNRNRTGENLSDDPQTLLIVATLVAAMTFQAITSPPGGFIQLPFEKNDASNFTRWIDKWEHEMYPAGRPVLLHECEQFFVLNSLALFSSVSVILWLLIAEPKTNIGMKFLVAVVWFAAFCTALAYASVYRVFHYPDDIYNKITESFTWTNLILIAWFLFYAIAGLRATVLVVSFLWREAGFKRKAIPNSNWIPILVRRSKEGNSNTTRFGKIIYVVSMMCVLAAFVVVTLGVFVLFTITTRTRQEPKDPTRPV